MQDKSYVTPTESDENSWYPVYSPAPQDKMQEGILIFTKWQTIFHKQEDGKKSENNYCYWGTNKIPKRFVETLNLENSERISQEDNFRYRIIKEFPIYMAVNGKIAGYFMIHNIQQGDYDDLNDQSTDYWLIFYSESWKEITDGEVLKPSQGWRYYPKPPATEQSS